MGVIYYSHLIGVSGPELGGQTVGEYTVETALAWALDDLRSGRATVADLRER